MKVSTVSSHVDHGDDFKSTYPDLVSILHRYYITHKDSHLNGKREELRKSVDELSSRKLKLEEVIVNIENEKREQYRLDILKKALIKINSLSMEGLSGAKKQKLLNVVDKTKKMSVERLLSLNMTLDESLNKSKPEEKIFRN